MKLFTMLFAILFIALFQINSFSQEIPNAGFENWTNGNPDGWYTDNITGFATPVTQSSQSHSGSSAAKLEVISYLNYAFAPTMYSGNSVLDGIPVSQAYGSLTGYYQFSQVGGDVAYAEVLMQKNGGYIGAGAIALNSGTTGYTQFVVPIDYISNETPDTVHIWFAIGDSSGNGPDVGSSLLIDDLAFGGVVGVNDKAPTAETFQLKQNYPNPFNPSTTIEFSIPEESSVDLKVYNILGVKVASIVSGSYSPGDHKVSFNGENLASGIYLAKITATSKESNRTFSKIIKMTLLK